MKKLSLVLAGAMLMAFAVTSCKKTYNCVCTVGSTSVTVNSITKMTKSQATTWCNTASAGTCKLQ